MIEAMNAQPPPVVAVDLPSGINGTSGAVMGARRQRHADRDLLSQEARPSASARPASLRRDHRSPISAFPTAVLARIGPKTFENTPQLWRSAFPVPRMSGHKYDRGHAVVVSGPSWSTGAARLAARGALRAGAGLVTIASPREALAVNAAPTSRSWCGRSMAPSELTRVSCRPPA